MVMSNITKTTEGEASFRLKENFENEDKAIKGKEPIDSEVLIDEIKIFCNFCLFHLIKSF